MWTSRGIPFANGRIQYYINNMVLVDSITIPPKFLSAEPLAQNVIAVTTQGAVNFSAVSVTLNNAVRVSALRSLV
jgi:hypothetical protein